jgi:DNA polymerase
MSGSVVIDVETRGLADLRKVGAQRYATDPATDIWCVAYAVNDDPVALWLPGEPVPSTIMQTAADPDTLWIAHNATFEILIWQNILAPRHGWPALPALSRWRCTMVGCLAAAAPPGLKEAADVFGLAHRKGDDRVMHTMSKPRAPRLGEDPAGTYWFDDPERCEALFDYCRGDVACERDLPVVVAHILTAAERALWCLDQEINARGVYVDGNLTAKAITIATAAMQAIQAELSAITAGAVASTNQVERILIWLHEHDCKLKDLKQGTRSAALRRANLDPTVRRVLELRSEAAHPALAKYRALQRHRDADGRVRHALRFHGAATGRWSSLGIQLHNLRRETENTAAKVAAILTGDIEEVRKLGPPLEVVSDVIRATICAAPGNRLMIADFSGVESRVLAWLANEPDKLKQWEAFDRTQDKADHPYSRIAAALGFTGTDAYDKGKRADLAFGFGGGRRRRHRQRRAN